MVYNETLVMLVNHVKVSIYSSWSCNVCESSEEKLLTNKCVNVKVRYTLFANMTNRGTKLFFGRIKYCWRKRDESVAVHCSLFAINFSAADDFFSTKKFFVFVDETTTPMKILSTACGKKPVRKTWQTPFIDYLPYVIFSSFRPYFTVVRE